MRRYQAFLVGKDRRRESIKEITECRDDRSAIELARTYVDDHDVELFEGERPVAKLRTDDPPEKDATCGG